MKRLMGLLLVLVVTPARARASEPEWPGSLGVSVNPAGLQLALGVGRRWSLSASQQAILKDAHFSLRLTDRLNPSYNRLEGSLELSPLSILDLKAAGELVTYFGNFGHLIPFQSYDDDFSREARSARGDESVSAVGGRFALSPVLKVRAGRLSLRAGADFEWWAMDRPQPFFYEPFRGTLLRSEGDALVAASLVALVDASRPGRFQAGLLYDLTQVWDAPQNRKQRIGPLFSFGLGGKRLGVRKPVLFVSPLYYLEQPTRDSRFSAILWVSFSLKD